MLTPTPVQASVPSSYWIALPEDWLSIPASADFSVDDLASLGMRIEDLDPSARETVDRLLVDMVRLAAAKGASALAFMSMPIEEDLVIQAGLGVYFVTAREGNTHDLTELSSALRDERTRDIAIVELLPGQAVRRDARIRVPLDNDQPAGDASGEAFELLTVQYYLPVPGSPGSVIVLDFTTPTLQLAEDLRELFDAIAHTFEFITNEQDAPSPATPPGPA